MSAPETTRVCDGCGKTFAEADFSNNWEVCVGCSYHDHLPAERWIELLIDAGTWTEHDAELSPVDTLQFVDQKPYADRITDAQRNNRTKDALIAGSGKINGQPVQLGCFVFSFMGGSMGSVVGEKITRLFERALEKREPAIVISCSGGARMQEGMLSLMQLAKTMGALRRLRDEKIPFISVLTHPTTGGVAASFGLQGDVNLAEPKALIGFAGPRVVQGTIQQKLPKGFQRSEFLLEHGMVDRIVSRAELRDTIATLLDYFVS